MVLVVGVLVIVQRAALNVNAAEFACTKYSSIRYSSMHPFKLGLKAVSNSLQISKKWLFGPVPMVRPLCPFTSCAHDIVAGLNRLS